MIVVAALGISGIARAYAPEVDPSAESSSLTDVRIPLLAKHGSCLRLSNGDGSQNHVRIPVDTSAVPLTETTISLWFRMDAPPGGVDGSNNPLFAFEQSASLNFSDVDRMISVHLGAIRVEVRKPNGTSEVVTSPGNGYRDGQWHHVAHTLGQAGSILYVDGVEVARGAATVSSAANIQFVTLGWGKGHAPPWAVPEMGDIDEVRVHTAALTQAEIRGLMFQEIPGSTANLFGYWRLEDDTVRDHGPHHWAGTTVGTVSYVPSDAPIYNRALRFDGVDDRVTVAGASGLGVDDGWFTVEAWIFPTDDEDGTIVNNEGRYSLRRKADGHIAWAMRTASLQYDEHVTNLVAPQGQWTHVALTYNPASMRVDVYANGVAAPKVVSQGPVGDAVPAYDEFSIGGRGSCHKLVCGFVSPFAGVIDEVRVWGVARSQAEIVDAMVRQLPGSSSQLQGYWNFNEATGTTVFDSAQEPGLDTVQDGTLVNGPLREHVSSARLRDIP